MVASTLLMWAAASAEIYVSKMGIIMALNFSMIMRWIHLHKLEVWHCKIFFVEMNM
jgi:hypothetical protein